MVIDCNKIQSGSSYFFKSKKKMEDRKKIARTAGFFYLLVVIFSFLTMAIIPSKIVVWDDHPATMGNLIAYEPLFRFGIVAGILVHLSYIVLPLTLYRLLHHIHKNYATLMVVFAIISVPISYTLLLDQFEIIELLKEYSSFGAAEKEQAGLQVLTMYDNLYDGFSLCQVFWGLWLLPFGYLVFKSGFLPKTLGVFLMLGCLAYLTNVFGRILFPDFSDYISTRLLILPATIGEIGICLWLLIIGTKENIKF